MADKMLHNRNFCKNCGKPGWVAQTLKSLSRETTPAKERPLEIQNPVGAFTCLLCQRYLKSTWNTCTCHKLISAAARKSNSVLACDDWQKLMNIFRLCRVFRVLFLRVQKYPILGKKEEKILSPQHPVPSRDSSLMEETPPWEIHLKAGTIQGRAGSLCWQLNSFSLWSHHFISLALSYSGSISPPFSHSLPHRSCKSLIWGSSWAFYMQEPGVVSVVQLPSAIGQNTLFLGFKLHRGQTGSPVNPKIWESEFPAPGKIQGEGKLLNFRGWQEWGRQAMLDHGH